MVPLGLPAHLFFLSIALVQLVSVGGEDAPNFFHATRRPLEVTNYFTVRGRGFFSKRTEPSLSNILLAGQNFYLKAEMVSFLSASDSFPTEKLTSTARILKLILKLIGYSQGSGRKLGTSSAIWFSLITFKEPCHDWRILKSSAQIFQVRFQSSPSLFLYMVYYYLFGVFLF